MKEIHKGHIWYKNFRFLSGMSLVILSFILGFYGKVLFIARFYDIISVITGLSIYAISWVMLFCGAFLVGWESVKIMQHKIQDEVTRTMRSTYDYTKKIQNKGIDYTKKLGKNLQRKGMDKK